MNDPRDSLASGERRPGAAREGGIGGASVGDVEPAIGEITDARREPEPHQQTEHVIDRAGRVGIMLANFQRAFVSMLFRKDSA